MTREKALEQLRIGPGINEDVSEDYNDAVNIAIKALEQETCDDAVSRASVFEILGNLMSIPYDLDRPINKDDVSESMDAIRALPPVTPKGVTVTDFADKCRECGARYGKQLKKLERIKARYNEERTILLNSNLEYAPNNVLDIIDYIIHGD